MLLLFGATRVLAESVYVNGQLVLLNPSDHGTGWAVALATGTPVAERRNLFLEAELTTTLAKPKRDSEEMTYTGVGGYGVYQRLIDERFAVHAKLGLLFQYSETTKGASESGAGIAFAIGGTIHRNREMSYLLELVSVEGTLDLSALSAGIRYRFR